MILSMHVLFQNENKFILHFYLKSLAHYNEKNKIREKNKNKEKKIIELKLSSKEKKTLNINFQSLDKSENGKTFFFYNF